MSNPNRASRETWVQSMMKIHNRTVLARLFDGYALAEFTLVSMKANQALRFIADYIGALQWLEIQGAVALESFLKEEEKLNMVTGWGPDDLSVRITSNGNPYPAHLRPLIFFKDSRCGLFFVEKVHEPGLAKFLIPGCRCYNNPHLNPVYLGRNRFLALTKIKTDQRPETRSSPLTAFG